MEEISTPARPSAWRMVRAYVPLPALLSFAFALLAATVHIIACNSIAFADFINLRVGAAFRFVLAKITDIFPFSLAETALIAVPFLLVLTVVLAVLLDTKRSCRMLASVLAVATLFYGLFVFTIGCGYRGSTLDSQLGMERKAVSASELAATAAWLAGEANALVPQVAYTANGNSVMPYSYEEMNKKLLASYARLSEEHPFLQRMDTRIKPVTFSEAMSYLHLTGVYTYMTGEANLNVGFPDFYTPFTAAHELAHQRGIAREDEANFVAFLVCIGSEDPYLRYSGYMNLLLYTGNALYSVSPDAYNALYAGYSYSVAYEFYAYGKFYEKYQDSVAGNISGSINDAYLQIQGTQGTRSYGMVVDLAVAHFLEEFVKTQE